MSKKNRFRDMHGNRISESQFAEKAAEYLGKSQWKKPEETQEKREKAEKYKNSSLLEEGETIKVKDSEFDMNLT